MPMPEYEKLRNKQSGLYRRETPPTGWAKFWSNAGKVLNSSVTTWVLTVTFGSMVAYTYANLQACLKDGDERAAKLNRLVSEMHDRYALIIVAVKQANSARDLTERLAKVPFTRVEFKDATMAALSADFVDLMSYVRPAELRQQGMINAIRASGLTPSELQAVRYTLVIGRPPDGLTDENLETFKALGPKFQQLILGSVKFNTDWQPVAYCTLPNAFLSLWRSRGPTVEYVPRPLPDLL